MLAFSSVSSTDINSDMGRSEDWCSAPTLTVFRVVFCRNSSMKLPPPLPGVETLLEKLSRGLGEDTTGFGGPFTGFGETTAGFRKTSVGFGGTTGDFGRAGVCCGERVVGFGPTQVGFGATPGGAGLGRVLGFGLIVGGGGLGDVGQSLDSGERGKVVFDSLRQGTGGSVCSMTAGGEPLTDVIRG